jgi:nucleotide-binding universal stress UspA family protein
VDSLVNQLEKRGWLAEGHSLQGDPGEELVRAIEGLDPDLVAVYSSEKGLIERAYMGSVSTHLLHNLHVTVLVLK